MVGHVGGQVLCCQLRCPVQAGTQTCACSVTALLRLCAVCVQEADVATGLGAPGALMAPILPPVSAPRTLPACHSVNEFRVKNNHLNLMSENERGSLARMETAQEHPAAPSSTQQQVKNK